MRFLERTEPEVEGRALEEPGPTDRARLRRFARGELPPAEQKELFDRLNRNRRWTAVLADEVKALRTPPAGDTDN